MKMKRWLKWHKPEPLPPGEARDPFEAVPVVAEGVEAKEDTHGCVQLRKLPASPPGVRARLRERLGFERPVRVSLDEFGSGYWRLVDGHRTLRAIEKEMRRKSGHSQKESERAVILFTHTLMLRHLIYLEVPADRDRAS